MGKREISLERFWDRPLPDLLHLLQTTPAGLSSAEATQRLPADARLLQVRDRLAYREPALTWAYWPHLDRYNLLPVC